MKKALLLGGLLAFSSTAAFAGWTDGTFGGLAAKIYTPDTKSASGRILYVNLHGCAQKTTDLQKSNWDGVAEKYNAVVVLPTAANPTLIGCYNYGNPSMNQADVDSIVKGTKAFIADAKYGIDPNQVYMTGISAGATFAATIACSYPDLYAGAGIAAGPTIKSNQQNAMAGETPNVDTAVNYCKGLAAGKESYYATQLYAQTYGADPAAGDGVIGKGFIEPNHKVQQKLYGLTGAASYKNDLRASTPTAGHTSTNEAEYYINDNNSNKRISLIVITGMGHAWPGGTPKSGTVGSYVKSNFDFGEWMSVNFTANNCRMAANKSKSICGTPNTTPGPVKNLSCGSATTNSVNLLWSAADGDLDGYKVQQGTTTQTTTATSYTWNGLSQGQTYGFTVWATKGATEGPKTSINCATPAPVTTTTTSSSSTAATTTSTTKATTTSSTTAATTTSTTKATTSTTTSSTASSTAATTTTTTTSTTQSGSTGACYKASTATHTWMGRAYAFGTRVYALGSNADMGYYSAFSSVKLRQIKLGYYTVDPSCP